MKIWIIWLPNVWKSTLFNALTQTYSADAANFPFCTIEPNIWIVDVKDARLDTLSQMSNSKKTLYSTIKFVDIAWLVKWAAQWAGLWNKFLSHIREVDALVQVVRHFDHADVIHVHNKIDPMDDVDTINTELIIADLEQIEKTHAQLSKAKRSKDQDALLEVVTICFNDLKNWIMIYDSEFSTEQKKILAWLQLLTAKPLIYALNIAENKLSDYHSIEKEFAMLLHKPVISVCAQFESELLGLDEAERADYVWWFGDVPTLDRLIACAFDAVGLMYYFTTWEKESRSRTIPKWSTAPQAAWAIHTDFERWFIKAEVIAYDDFVKSWSRSKARESWHLKLQWKEYIVQDWDIIVFKFNV